MQMCICVGMYARMCACVTPQAAVGSMCMNVCAHACAFACVRKCVWKSVYLVMKPSFSWGWPDRGRGGSIKKDPPLFGGQLEGSILKRPSDPLFVWGVGESQFFGVGGRVLCLKLGIC